MRNQFFYTVIQDDKDAPKVIGSFAIDKVVRTIEYKPNCRVVLLNDFHEEQGKRPSPRGNGKITMETFKETVYSSIYLDEQDSLRFKKLTEIQEPVFIEEEGNA